MTLTRASFVRSAFTLIAGVFLLAAMPAKADTSNDAALVMDAESGRVLYARSGDAPRSPASLTKIMTLYMLFDELRAGRISIDDTMTASKHAASQKPTKLGLKAGDTLTVEQAIYSLVVQSANDASVVIAEHIGGTEAQFARMMTQKARDLGMRRTTFRNANGLPDAGQLTTARDMAILSRSIMRNHPKYYAYFSATEFTFRGNTKKTHNRVLVGLRGANGIKTGYTRASGFNLTTSAERNGKRLVGVVLGGDSWLARDNEMKTMLEAWFAQIERRPALVASYSAATTTLAEVTRSRPVEVAAAEKPGRKNKARALVADASETPKSKKSTKTTALAAAPVIPSTKPKAVAAVAKSRARDVEVAEGDAVEAEPVVKKARNKPGTLALASTGKTGKTDKIATLISTGYTKDKPSKAKAGSKTGDWGIQIGAFDSRKSAATELARARAAAKRALAAASDSVTEVTTESGRTFYRARFSTFTSADAQAACSALKDDGFKCVTFSTSTAEAR
jgi:D-alanyl-D-alanine carboxypeptidase